MFNIKRNKPIIFHIILGIFLVNVLIYYFYYLFSLFGETEKIPIIAFQYGYHFCYYQFLYLLDWLELMKNKFNLLAW